MTEDEPALRPIDELYTRVVETLTTVRYRELEVGKTRRRIKLRIETLEREAVGIDPADSMARWRCADALSDERTRLLLLDAHEERMAGVAQRLQVMAVRRRSWIETITSAPIAATLVHDMRRAGFGRQTAGGLVDAGIDVGHVADYTEALIGEADHAVEMWHAWVGSAGPDHHA